MSLHPPVKPTDLSSLSFEPPSPAMGGLVGSLKIPIIPYGSKWKSAVDKPREPFFVKFDTHTEDGVLYRELVSHSAGCLNAMIQNGENPVFFPAQGGKIQFRIVWPGYETVDFRKAIDPRSVTVSRLAGSIASLYSEFFQMASLRECAAHGLPVTPELLETLRIHEIQNVSDHIYQTQRKGQTITIYCAISTNQAVSHPHSSKNWSDRMF